VLAILSQHHEKFDGTGYPKGLKGFSVDDISQLLSIADLVDTVGSGHWDGKERTLKETLEEIETMEKSRTFPEHFNPEVYAAVMRWVRSIPDPRADQGLRSAAQVVRDEFAGKVTRRAA
jgi:HD-GYP domain-containing protein (c-di-GMP phosphodiesterase class II)